ncbi:hypothetical protein SKAU_G00094070 [Synaphobranchus kaupii]|uniref:Uncharacterized protein n=1 Tax=Synaphobranchus kaupii TaxID=118154 RepID=A0A9Q1J6G8_SYNKA|nr:hypothetical protein SKAU_G00094070 [Synaphobranchus kaupii]
MLYKTLVSLERKHGVELGVTYHNNKACHIFIEHIAGSMRDSQAAIRCEPFYCSLLFDGSTDKGISEKEGTQWNDQRRRAVSCLATSNYRSIIHLQERQDEAGPEKEKITAMFKQLTSPKFVLYMVLYQLTWLNSRWTFREINCPYPQCGLGSWLPRLRGLNKRRNQALIIAWSSHPSPAPMVSDTREWR